MRAWGQVEVPGAVVTAAVALATSALTGVVTFTIGQASAAAEFRATVSSHEQRLERLDGLPVADLKALPARFEVYAAAVEMQVKTTEEMKVLVQSFVRTRPASGKRP